MILQTQTCGGIDVTFDLAVLDLSVNALSELPMSLVNSLTNPQNSTQQLSRLDLGSNPWTCNCSLLRLAPLLRFL
jgi:hypothetical protein